LGERGLVSPKFKNIFGAAVRILLPLFAWRGTIPEPWLQTAQKARSDFLHLVRINGYRRVMTLTLNFDLPDELAQLRLPNAVAARLQALLDRQDAGHPLSNFERAEAEGLAHLTEFLTLLRLRSERAAS
jgi:hypothetical protein